MRLRYMRHEIPEYPTFCESIPVRRQTVDVPSIGQSVITCPQCGFAALRSCLLMRASTSMNAPAAIFCSSQNRVIAASSVRFGPVPTHSAIANVVVLHPVTLPSRNTLAFATRPWRHSIRSTGPAGTRLLAGQHRRGPPVSLIRFRRPMTWIVAICPYRYPTSCPQVTVVATRKEIACHRRTYFAPRSSRWLYSPWRPAARCQDRRTPVLS